jgi:hypothetical protein
MFVGHFAVGLAGKRAAPRVSLGTWLMAGQLMDLLWPIFLLLGWEHMRVVPGLMKISPLDLYDYPITHSLVGALGWSVVMAVGYLVLGRGESAPQARRRNALLLAAGVFSHWILDVLVHRPDVPILPHGPYIGLGLWNYPWIEVPLEGGLYLLGIFLYLRATRARDRVGSWGLYILLAFLFATWMLGSYGPPPSTEALKWSSLTLWLIVVWGYWIDRHRTPKGESS